MPRYDSPNIFFFAPTNLTTALSGGATRPLESLSVTSRLGGVGDFECTYPYPIQIDGGYIAFGVLEAVGNVVVFVYNDNRYPAGSGRTRAFGDCYRIESAVVEDRPSGGPVVRLRGRSLLAELEDKTVWTPVGNQTAYNTTIHADHALTAPSTTTLSSAYSAGTTEIVVADGAAFIVSDMILIPLTGGGTLITTVASKGQDEDGDELPNEITLANPLPGGASSGATVTRRPRRVVLTETENATEGSRIQITMNSGTHTTLIERGPEEETDPDDPEAPPVIAILVRDGLTAAANAGNSVQITDTSAPSTTDIAQIIANAPGWSSDLSGIGSGSAHVPEGATVYELLESVAEINATWFKQDYDETNRRPLRAIKWGLTNSGSGGKIVLENPRISALPGFEVTNNRGVISGSVSREWKWNTVTRIYPTGGDPGVSLYGVSSATRTILSGLGLTIVDDAATLGLYEEPYIKNTALEPGTIVGQAVTFGDIVPQTTAGLASMNACDILALRAMEWLLARDRTYWEWRISGVEIASAVVLEVGQYVDLTRTLDNQAVKTTPTQDSVSDLITREVTLRWDSGAGVPLFDLTLSDAAGNPSDGGRAVTSTFRTYDRMIRRVATGRDDRDTLRFVGASTTPSAHSHTEYLLKSGGNMSGNLTLNGGITVDGVDISAHAANPAAHHNPVTAGDTSIALATQAVSVFPNTTGGLETSSGLRVKLPVNSGIVRDSTGLSLGTSTLTATTTNAVSGGSHTHAITATDNANTTPSALLKGSGSGALTLAALGVGDTTVTTATIYAKSKAVDDFTLYLKQLSGQTASMIRVEATAGHALILLTGEGDLESGNPGFVSGQTGWQITATGDAEFNNAFIRGELHAVTFVADEMHATGGTLAVMTATRVAPAVGANDNKLGALAASFTLNVQASYDTGLCYFAVNDIIRCKPMGEIASGGSLDLYDIYLHVTAVGSQAGRDLANGEAGYHPLTVVRRSGGATNFIIPTGAAAVKWAESGGSGYTGGIILTSDLNQSPYIDIFTIDASVAGSSWSTPVTPTPRVRIGNLDGVLGLAEQWGIAAGTDLSDTSLTAPSLVASDLGLTLKNIDLSMYYGAARTFYLSANGYLSLGTDISVVADRFLYADPVSGIFRIGKTGSNQPNLYWDAAGIKLRSNTTSVIQFDSDGSSYFAGPMTIGSSGGIYQGTGTFGSPTDGLKIWNASGDGVLGVFKGGTRRIGLKSDRGIEISNTSGKANDAALIFSQSAGGTVYGGLYFYKTGTDSIARLEITEGGRTARLQLVSDSARVYTELSDGTTLFRLDSVNDYALLENADLYIKQSGLAVGYTTTPALNRGQIATDFAGEHDFNAIVLQDTGDIAHGMTSVVATSTFGSLGKVSDANGGVAMGGYTGGIVGVNVNGYGTTVSSTEATSSSGQVQISAYLKSGSSTTTLGNDDNLLAVRNTTNTQFIVKGNGDFYYNGAGAAYDALDDVAMLRTLARETWAGTLDLAWDRFIDYNRANLIEAGVLSAGGFINGAALNRLLVGAIGQLHERIRTLETLKNGT